MANISLQPGIEDLSTADLIGRVDDGIYIVGDKSWSIDMQRYNFQFTGQRFFRIRGGQLYGQLRDVAYQSSTTDFWNAMEAVGGPSTWRMGGAINCGKAQPARLPRSAMAVRRRCSGASMCSILVLKVVDDRAAARRQHRFKGSGQVWPGGRDHGAGHRKVEATLRWAGNSMTTNGVSHSRNVTVISIVRRGDSAFVGSVVSAEVDPSVLPGLVVSSQDAARSAPEAGDAAPLLADTGGPTTGMPRFRAPGQGFSPVSPAH